MSLTIFSQLLILPILEQFGKDVLPCHNSAERSKGLTICFTNSTSDVTGPAISARGNIPVPHVERNFHAISQHDLDIVNATERCLCEHSLSSLHLCYNDIASTRCDLGNDSFNSI